MSPIPRLPLALSAAVEPCAFTGGIFEELENRQNTATPVRRAGSTRERIAKSACCSSELCKPKQTKHNQNNYSNTPQLSKHNTGATAGGAQRRRTQQQQGARTAPQGAAPRDSGSQHRLLQCHWSAALNADTKCQRCLQLTQQERCAREAAGLRSKQVQCSTHMPAQVQTLRRRSALPTG